jgi:pimeloyl-ACP methyl ester carboxylesterase
VQDSLEARYERFLREVPSGSATYDGVAWRWYDQGQGPLARVVLPGAVGGADVFFVLFEVLQPYIRVVGLDLPFVEDAAAAAHQMDTLLASRGIERAIFLGASFSGLFMQAFARRHPQRTRALILSHTGALDAARAARQRVNARRAARFPLPILRGLLRLVVRLLLRRVDGRRFWTVRYDAALDALTREALVSRYRLEASIEELVGPPWAGDVLIIHSDNDAIAKPEQQARLRQQYPGARWVQFKGAGHSSYSRDPLAYSAAVREFVSTLASAYRSTSAFTPKN